ncbi:MAG: adenylate kinase [Balneolaceae bacterium]|nr:adenylate kinase [Balneolaceae bacterium]
MRIIIFGPPGAGKGTQAKRISREYNIPHLSTGEIFRSAIREDMPLGEKIKSYIDKGNLVPDHIVMNMVERELDKEKYEKGYVMDGFPRTVPQAEAFNTLLESKGRSLTALLVLMVPEEELIERILNRGEGRSDDTLERVKNRLAVYREETKPVLDYFQDKNKVEKINGVGSIDLIFNRIKERLERALENNTT